MPDRTAAGARTIATDRIVPAINLGKCVDFALVNSLVTFSSPVSMNPANLTQFSAAVWIYPKSVTHGYDARIYASTGIGNDGKGFDIIMRNGGNGEVEATVSHNVASAFARYPRGLIKRSVWQRLLFTWDDADNIPRIYLNGEEVTPSATQNKSGVRVNWNGTTARIGNSGALTRGIIALLDEFCVWNRIVTAQEIKDDYFKALVPTSGLILRYQMDEASGNLVDASGNSITGTPADVTQNVTSYSVPLRSSA